MYCKKIKLSTGAIVESYIITKSMQKKEVPMSGHLIYIQRY